MLSLPSLLMFTCSLHSCCCLRSQVDLGLAIRLPLPAQGGRRPTCSTTYQSDQRVGVFGYMPPEVRVLSHHRPTTANFCLQIRVRLESRCIVIAS